LTGRKFIVYIAVSADGYIARSDGSVDFLDRPRPAGNYGMNAFLRSVDSILWGRKTWDLARMMGSANMGSPDPFGWKLRNCVFSRRAAASGEFTHEAPGDFAKRERGEPGRNFWIMGGGELIASFLEAGAIDEFIIHTIPVMIGEGIPLLRAKSASIALELLTARRFPDGVIRSHYRVTR
jgi:dihydrofolate reductase